MNESKKSKPLILAMQEAESALVKTVNEIMQDVPCYFVEIIFDKIHRQLKDGASKEVANARTRYAAETEKTAETDEASDESTAGPDDVTD